VEKIFAVINQMETDGVIGRYAIGGAVGAIFWIEPITTKDVDVFVTLATAPGVLVQRECPKVMGELSYSLGGLLFG
jgi:hypothetical protein